MTISINLPKLPQKLIYLVNYFIDDLSIANAATGSNRLEKYWLIDIIFDQGQNKVII